MKINRPYLRFITEAETAGDTGTTDAGASTASTAETSTKETADTVSDKDLGDAGKKALQAERDARKVAEKAATDALAKVKTFEDAQKTQAEKDAESRAALEKTSTENAAKALRYEAAEKAGLPLAAAARLQGSTLDELVKDAEVLKGLGIGATSGESKTGTPKPDKTQAATGGKTAPKNLNEAVSNHYEN